MAENQEAKLSRCIICNKEFAAQELFPTALVRGSIVSTIKKSQPAWDSQSYICYGDLNRFRGEHVQDILEREIGEVSELEKSVIVSLKEHELISEDIQDDFSSRTLGTRLADKVAEIGGSWTFIFFFFLVLLVWISINSSYLLSTPFDPFPYILLNLCLSCLAAIQAPVIMMSQNRQEEKDRERSRNDYRINLKAELEIRHLHEKIDHLLLDQWKRLVDIQQQQMAILEDLAARKN